MQNKNFLKILEMIFHNIEHFISVIKYTQKKLLDANIQISLLWKIYIYVPLSLLVHVTNRHLY